jgi:predicted peptidase
VDSLLVETIVALQNEFPIDAKRLYVMGNSLGGYGAWHLACTRPGMFAAAVPICGGGDPALAKNLVNVPVWAFHGAKDMNVPVSGSRQMIEAIRNAGGDPKYTEYPEEAHDITRNVIETHELLDWMFERRRD